MADTKKAKIAWGEIIAFLLFAAAVFLVMRRSEVVVDQDLVPAGTPLPALMVEGWLNTDAPPTAEILKGKVVMIDCWATWCPPCREGIPELAKIYAEYRDQDVVFLGLTPEEGSASRAVESFVQDIPGFDWPVGYGSMLTLDVLDIMQFPTMIVFDKQGRVIWSSSYHAGLRGALDQALAL